MLTSPDPFSMSFMGRQQRAEIGGVGLFENWFRVSRTDSQAQRLCSFAREDSWKLLPRPSPDEYIGVRRAAKMSGIRVSDLRELCLVGEINHRLVNGKPPRLEISLNSLLVYIARKM